MSRDDYARAIIAEGQRRRITPRGIVIALATALVESNLVMYANPADPDSVNYPHDALSDDANSVGLFQQRAPWWGTVADRMDPTASAGMFYDRLARLYYNDPDQTPGSFAQAVQRSAFPDRYDLRMAEAQTLYDRLVTGQPKTGPDYRELDYMTGGGRSVRTRPPTLFLLHTQEGDGSAEDLARFCDGSRNVSYHYTLRDQVVCDVVDTDYSSWSVLDANTDSINLCFAGAYAGWDRATWLRRDTDIEVAAWLAVTDCRKYGIPADVNPPPYRKGPGISDHNYVTKILGIGTHWDVGPGFPWDVFTRCVQRFIGGDTELTPDQARMLEDLHGALFGPIPSQSKYRSENEAAKWNLYQLVRNTDSMTHEALVERAALLGNQEAMALVLREADKGDVWAQTVYRNCPGAQDTR